jgi:hypothetical protein
VTDEWMCLENWWNNTEKKTPNYAERKKDPPQFYFVPHKFHIDRPGIQPGLPRTG